MVLPLLALPAGAAAAGTAGTGAAAGTGGIGAGLLGGGATGGMAGMGELLGLGGLGQTGAVGGMGSLAGGSGLGGGGFSLAELLKALIANQQGQPGKVTSPLGDDLRGSSGGPTGLAEAPRGSGIPYIFTGGQPFPANEKAQRIQGGGAILGNLLSVLNAAKQGVGPIAEGKAPGAGNPGGAIQSTPSGDPTMLLKMLMGGLGGG